MDRVWEQAVAVEEGASSGLEECSGTCAPRGQIQDQVQNTQAGRSWSLQQEARGRRNEKEEGMLGSLWPSSPRHPTFAPPPPPPSPAGLQGPSPNTPACPASQGCSKVRQPRLRTALGLSQPPCGFCSLSFWIHFPLQGFSL